MPFVKNSAAPEKVHGLQLNIPLPLFERVEQLVQRRREAMLDTHNRFTGEELRSLLNMLATQDKGSVHALAKSIHNEKVARCVKTSRVSRVSTLLSLIELGLSLIPEHPEFFTLRQVLDAIDGAGNKPTGPFAPPAKTATAKK